MMGFEEYLRENCGLLPEFLARILIFEDADLWEWCEIGDWDLHCVASD